MSEWIQNNELGGSVRGKLNILKDTVDYLLSVTGSTSSGGTGTSGINGTSGSNGTSGTDGTSAGTSGTDGATGSSGSSPYKGLWLDSICYFVGDIVSYNNVLYTCIINIINCGGIDPTNPPTVDVAYWISLVGSSGSSGVSGGGTGGVGSSGSSGSSGIGVSGTSGSSGSSGIGVSGTSGSSGTNGSSGVNGTSGSSGSSGTNGTSGSSGLIPVASNRSQSFNESTIQIDFSNDFIVTDPSYLLTGYTLTNGNKTFTIINPVLNKVVTCLIPILSGSTVIILPSTVDVILGTWSTTNRNILMLCCVDDVSVTYKYLATITQSIWEVI